MAPNRIPIPPSGDYAYFDKLARRYLEDGRSDNGTLAGIEGQLERFSRLRAGAMPDKPLERIAALRAAMPAEPSDRIESGTVVGSIEGLRRSAPLRTPPAKTDPRPVRRGPGRPEWTRALFRERLAEAEAATREPRTDPAIARHFRGLSADGALGLDPESLARLRRRYDRGDMPE